MHVSVLNMGASRFVRIQTRETDLSVLVDPDKADSTSLHDEAQRLRQQAERLVKRASLIERAIGLPPKQGLDDE